LAGNADLTKVQEPTASPTHGEHGVSQKGPKIRALDNQRHTKLQKPNLHISHGSGDEVRGERWTNGGSKPPPPRAVPTYQVPETKG
jgi:hypothetical protein